MGLGGPGSGDLPLGLLGHISASGGHACPSCLALESTRRPHTGCVLCSSSWWVLVTTKSCSSIGEAEAKHCPQPAVLAGTSDHSGVVSRPEHLLPLNALALQTRMSTSLTGPLPQAHLSVVVAEAGTLHVSACETWCFTFVVVVVFCLNLVQSFTPAQGPGLQIFQFVKGSWWPVAAAGLLAQSCRAAPSSAARPQCGVLCRGSRACSH